MDWIAVGSVYGVLLITGVVISLLSTQLQCSKISFSVAFLEGLKFGVIPTILYGVATYFEVVRTPFIDFFASRGLEKSAPVFGIGYLIMLGAWVSGVWNVHNSEIATCVPSTSEMTEFKEKLMKELADKQAAEEKNATAKPSQ
jgi:hypothetical protein